MLINLLIISYLFLAWVLILKYQKMMTWDKGTTLSWLATCLIQPFMEIFANTKTTHAFSWITFENDKIITQQYLHIAPTTNPIRQFNKGLLTIILSAFVDVYPWQDCAIVRPKDLNLQNQKWRLGFHICNNQYQKAKFSQFGSVKIVCDGGGNLIGFDENMQQIELEIIKHCQAYQNREVLFI